MLALSLAATGAGIGLGPVPRAAAVTPPVAFTADALPTWQPNGVVWALAEAGGTVFVGGTFSAVRPPEGGGGTEQPALNFAALDAATGAPTSCTLSFTVGSGTATVRALALSPDKKTLYAGGWFGAVNGTPVSSLAAVDVATCTVKTSFRPAFAATVRALAVTADTVYAGGDFLTVAGQPRQRFAAVAASDGALKPFRADADEPGRAIEVTPDGADVVLGGDFFTVNGTDTHALAVVDAATGTLTKAYPGFIQTNSVVKDIATDATGIYTANEGTGGGVFDGRIALGLTDFNQRWRDTCLGATQAVLPYRNVLYSASHAHDCSSVGEFPDGQRHHLLAQPTSGTGKLGWAPDTNDGIGEGIGPRVLAVGSKDGTSYLWAGGEFTTVNGAAQQSLTRFASTGDTGAPTTPLVSAAGFRPGEVQVRWRTSLDLDDSTLTYRIHRNGAATPIATVNADSLFFRRPQASWTDTSVTAGQTYTYRVTATDAAGNTSALSATASVTVPTSVEAYPSQVRADGAQLYWRYDESVLPYAADSSAAGNQNGIHLNAPALRQAPAAVSGASTAIGFNGTDTQVYGDRRQTVGSTYSIETWFRTNSTRGGKLFGFGSNQSRGSNQYDKHLYMTNDGRLVYGVYTGATRTITTAGSYNDDRWHHVVATQGPGGMVLYVDGAQKGTLGVTTHENLSLDVYKRQLRERPERGAGAEPPRPRLRPGRLGRPGDGRRGHLRQRGRPRHQLRHLGLARRPGHPAVHELPALRPARRARRHGAEVGHPEREDQHHERRRHGRHRLGRPGHRRMGGGHGHLHQPPRPRPVRDRQLSGRPRRLGGPHHRPVQTSGGTDALWLWSSEAQANEGTPQLTLTFGVP